METGRLVRLGYIYLHQAHFVVEHKCKFPQSEIDVLKEIMKYRIPSIEKRHDFYSKWVNYGIYNVKKVCGWFNKDIASKCVDGIAI